MFDLEIKEHREKLAERIKDDINDYCVAKYRDPHRSHLGASELGDNCSRKLWYKFRWVKEEQHSGRIHRLFQVGHSAEPRFIDYLRGIGFEVKPFAQQLWYSSQLNEYKILELDADLSGGTGSFEPVDDTFHIKEAKKRGLELKQFRISGHNGHYGGSLDGICKAPAHYEIKDNLAFLNEFKTNGTGAGFANIATKGVQKEKPRHWAQMCQYGYHYKLKYGLYLIENKNDSDLTPQIVELDWKLGQELQNKAGDIINAKIQPARVSENPAYFDCKYCTFVDICHNGASVEINCRSCKFADPIENAEWFCNRWQKLIPSEHIKDGCPGHSSIST